MTAIGTHTLEVTTGVAWATSENPTRWAGVTCDGPVDPEAVFRAANRIDSLEGDLAGLSSTWQRALRRAIDEQEIASMSVGDRFEVRDANDVIVQAAVVERFGFTTVIPAPTTSPARSV